MNSMKSLKYARGMQINQNSGYTSIESKPAVDRFHFVIPKPWYKANLDRDSFYF